MLDQFLTFFEALGDQTGFAAFYWGNVLMIAVGTVTLSRISGGTHAD